MSIKNSPLRGIRSVRADGGDLTCVLAELQGTFATFRQENDQALADLRRGREDYVQSEKVDRINASISELDTAVTEIRSAMASMRVGSGDDQRGLTPEQRAHANAFGDWFRRGTEPEAGMRQLEVNARLTTQSDPDGGYLVPTEMDAAIDRVLTTVSAIRSISRVVNTGSADYKKLVNLGGATALWQGEEQSRPESASPRLAEILIAAGELSANPFATQRMLDDAAIDIEAWLAEEVATSFAEAEGAAFVNGTGINRPRGILNYDTVENGSYAWGKLGFKVTGAAANFATSGPGDALIELFYSLKAGYRTGATWVTSDAVAGAMRKFKDGQGNYLWAPPSEDMPATILGKPVVTDDNMPALGANAFPVAFGNFRRGYMIADRMGTRVLRDPYTSKPHVSFFTTKRVGAAVVNFEAIKLLKCST